MPRRPHDPVAARLVDPRLTESLRRYLRSRSIPAGEVDEILDRARMQLVERGLPATPVEVDRLLFRIARCRAMDWHREMRPARLGGESVTIALCTNRPPEYEFAVPPEAEAALRALERLVADNPRNAHALEAIRQKMAGKSIEEYAAQAGVASGTMRQWVNRFRARACKQMPWCVGFF